MSSIDYGVNLPPEEQFHQSLGSIGTAPVPYPAAVPTAAPETQAAPAPAGPTPVADPSAGAALRPTADFDFAPPAVDPNAALAAAVRQGVREALPAAPAPAAVDPLLQHINEILSGDYSDEMKQAAQLNLLMYNRMAQREAETSAKLAEADRFLQAQREAQSDAVLSGLEADVNSKYTFTQAEWNDMYERWERGTQADPSMLNLRPIEAFRRIYGDDVVDARRKAPGAPPTLSIVNPPVNNDAHPQGHLASDAAGGAPARLNNGTGWTPPVRDKGPQLDDALRGAKNDPRFASR